MVVGLHIGDNMHCDPLMFVGTIVFIVLYGLGYSVVYWLKGDNNEGNKRNKGSGDEYSYTRTNVTDAVLEERRNKRIAKSRRIARRYSNKFEDRTNR